MLQRLCNEGPEARCATCSQMQPDHEFTLSLLPHDVKRVGDAPLATTSRYCMYYTHVIIAVVLANRQGCRGGHTGGCRREQTLQDASCYWEVQAQSKQEP